MNEIELGTGLCQYGDFIFPNAIHARLQSNPTQDSTQRFTKYTRHRLVVEVVLYPGVDEDYYGPGKPGENRLPFFPSTDLSADNGMTRARQELTTRGLPLVFESKGFGVFQINTLQQDVLAGPAPEILAWEPTGDNYAVRVVWGVEVTLAECPHVVSSLGQLTELSYDISWGIDLAGMTTRTMSGYWEIVLAVQRQGGFISNNADQVFRDQLRIPIPVGFSRVQQNYRLNARRDRVDFTIVDRENESDDRNPMPANLVQFRCAHTFSTLGQNILANAYISNIRASATVAKGKPRFFAWVAFLTVVKNRLRHAQEKTNVESRSPGQDEGTTRKGPAILPGKLTITEEIYGRRMSFSFSWIVYTAVKMAFDAAGFWTDADPGASPARQITALTQPGAAWTTRGVKQLRQQTRERLIGLCQSQNPTAPANGSALARSPGDTDEIFTCKKPPPEESYISFRPDAYLIEDTRRHASYAATGGVRNESAETSFDLARTEEAWTGTTGQSSSSTGPRRTAPPSIFQSGTQSHRVIFFGDASRLGYAVQEPHLKSFGGAQATVTGSKNYFHPFPPVDVGGCLLYRATWRKEYRLASEPSGNKIITDPAAESVNLVPPPGVFGP